MRKRRDCKYFVVQDNGVLVWSSGAPWPVKSTVGYLCLRYFTAYAHFPDGRKYVFRPNKGGWQELTEERWEAYR